MSQENVEIVARVLRALHRAGHRSGYRDLLDPDIELASSPERVGRSGRYHGSRTRSCAGALRGGLGELEDSSIGASSMDIGDHGDRRVVLSSGTGEGQRRSRSSSTHLACLRSRKGKIVRHRRSTGIAQEALKAVGLAE